jgi:hypothetical protein
VRILQKYSAVQCDGGTENVINFYVEYCRVSTWPMLSIQTSEMVVLADSRLMIRVPLYQPLPPQPSNIVLVPLAGYSRMIVQLFGCPWVDYFQDMTMKYSCPRVDYSQDISLKYSCPRVDYSQDISLKYSCPRLDYSQDISLKYSCPCVIIPRMLVEWSGYSWLICFQNIGDLVWLLLADLFPGY